MKMKLFGMVLTTVTVLLVGCQTASITVQPTTGVTVVPVATSTPGLSGERQVVEGYFSFISPDGFEAELEEKSVFISDAAEEVFISLAIIGQGDDERTAQGLLDDIFEGFDRVEIKDPETTNLDDLSGQRIDFSGVINSGVVSGYYITIDLGNGVSFLAFGMGKVTKTMDSWQQFGALNFAQLLDTVDISFGASF